MNKTFWVSGVALLAFSIYIQSNLFLFGFLIDRIHIVVLFIAIIMVMYMCYIDGLTAGYKKYMEENKEWLEGKLKEIDELKNRYIVAIKKNKMSNEN